jgi:hypothetical protein
MRIDFCSLGWLDPTEFEVQSPANHELFHINLP